MKTGLLLQLRQLRLALRWQVPRLLRRGDACRSCLLQHHHSQIVMRLRRCQHFGKDGEGFLVSSLLGQSQTEIHTDAVTNAFLLGRSRSRGFPGE